VSSISWALSGNQISVGTNSGKIQIWDSSTCKVIRELYGHESRVGTMAWNSTLLASGSRDRNIYLQDIRVRSYSYNNHTSNTTSMTNPSSYQNSSSPNTTTNPASFNIYNAQPGSSEIIHNFFQAGRSSIPPLQSNLFELFASHASNADESLDQLNDRNDTIDMDVMVRSVSSEAATIIDGEGDRVHTPTISHDSRGSRGTVPPRFSLGSSTSVSGDTRTLNMSPPRNRTPVTSRLV
jgi:WD40 repeat protein